jgi:catechol 2,3-dioxygenase-like lactoylglutathione lyase family enzyme
VLRRIDHVVAAVRDARSAFETFTRRLGLPVGWGVESHAGWESCALWLGDACLELVAPKAAAHSVEGSYFDRTLEAHGEGLVMLAFEPAGMSEAVAELRGRGVTVHEPEHRPSTSAEGMGFTTAFIGRRFTPGLRTILCEYDRPFRPTDDGGGPLKVKKLDHVVIATEDLEDAAAKWERNLGLTVEERLSRPLGSGFEVARLPVGDAFIELVKPVESTGRFAEQFKERGEGFFSISIEVDDLDEAVTYLRGKGARVSNTEPGIWPGSRVARINRSSTHGVSIQLIERR